jgi:hypothetical protein
VEEQSQDNELSIHNQRKDEWVELMPFEREKCNDAISFGKNHQFSPLHHRPFSWHGWVIDRFIDPNQEPQWLKQQKEHAIMLRQTMINYEIFTIKWSSSFHHRNLIGDISADVELWNASRLIERFQIPISIPTSISMLKWLSQDFRVNGEGSLHFWIFSRL